MINTMNFVYVNYITTIHYIVYIYYIYVLSQNLIDFNTLKNIVIEMHPLVPKNTIM